MPRPTLAPVAAVVLLTMAMLFGAYAAAYALLCEREVRSSARWRNETGGVIIRCYGTQLEVAIFRSAAFIDGLYRGKPVLVAVEVIGE
jgi:hypothetical protein